MCALRVGSRAAVDYKRAVLLDVDGLALGFCMPVVAVASGLGAVEHVAVEVQVERHALAHHDAPRILGVPIGTKLDADGLDEGRRAKLLNGAHHLVDIVDLLRALAVYGLGALGIKVGTNRAYGLGGRLRLPRLDCRNGNSRERNSEQDRCDPAQDSLLGGGCRLHNISL